MILEVASGIVFLSGYILWNKKTDLKKQITITMGTITFISIGVMFILQLGSQNWLLETLMVVLFAVGAIFLALEKAIGWLLYLAGHITLILYALTLETYFILALNIISIYFAIRGYYKLRRIEPSNQQGLQLSIL